MEGNVHSMTHPQEPCVTSSQDTSYSLSEERRSGVCALVSRLNSSGLDENDSVDISAEQVKKIHDTFPWMSKFCNKCQAAVGGKSVKVLENLVATYIQKVSVNVKDCYLKPNRAAKLKKCMSDILVFFHLRYQDTKETFEHSSWLDKMSELVSMYIDMEIKASRRGKESMKKIASRLICALYIFLDNSMEHILDTLLKTKLITKNYREIGVLILSKVLSEVPSHAVNKMLYIRYLLAFKLWKKVVPTADDRRGLNKLVAQKLPAPPHFMEKCKDLADVLPRIPKKKKNITLFLMQSKFNLKNACQAFLKHPKETQQVFPQSSAGEFKKPLFLVERSSDGAIVSESGDMDDDSGSSKLINDIWSSISKIDNNLPESSQLQEFSVEMGFSIGDEPSVVKVKSKPNVEKKKKKSKELKKKKLKGEKKNKKKNKKKALRLDKKSVKCSTLPDSVCVKPSKVQKDKEKKQVEKGEKAVPLQLNDLLLHAPPCDKMSCSNFGLENIEGVMEGSEILVTDLIKEKDITSDVLVTQFVHEKDITTDIPLARQMGDFPTAPIEHHLLSQVKLEATVSSASSLGASSSVQALEQVNDVNSVSEMLIDHKNIRVKKLDFSEIPDTVIVPTSSNDKLSIKCEMETSQKPIFGTPENSMVGTTIANEAATVLSVSMVSSNLEEMKVDPLWVESTTVPCSSASSYEICDSSVQNSVANEGFSVNDAKLIRMGTGLMSTDIMDSDAEMHTELTYQSSDNVPPFFCGDPLLGEAWDDQKPPYYQLPEGQNRDDLLLDHGQSEHLLRHSLELETCLAMFESNTGHVFYDVGSRFDGDKQIFDDQVASSFMSPGERAFYDMERSATSNANVTNDGDRESINDDSDSVGSSSHENTSCDRRTGKRGLGKITYRDARAFYGKSKQCNVRSGHFTSVKEIPVLNPSLPGFRDSSKINSPVSAPSVCSDKVSQNSLSDSSRSCMNVNLMRHCNLQNTSIVFSEQCVQGAGQNRAGMNYNRQYGTSKGTAQTLANKSGEFKNIKQSENSSYITQSVSPKIASSYRYPQTVGLPPLRGGKNTGVYVPDLILDVQNSTGKSSFSKDSAGWKRPVSRGMLVESTNKIEKPATAVSKSSATDRNGLTREVFTAGVPVPATVPANTYPVSASNDTRKALTEITSPRKCSCSQCSNYSLYGAVPVYSTSNGLHYSQVPPHFSNSGTNEGDKLLKPEDEELLKKIQESLTKSSYDLEADSSLPFKKRLKMSAKVTENETKSSIDNLTSYPPTPMISIAELEVNNNDLLKKMYNMTRKAGNTSVIVNNQSSAANAQSKSINVQYYQSSNENNSKQSNEKKTESQNQNATKQDTKSEINTSYSNKAMLPSEIPYNITKTEEISKPVPVVNNSGNEKFNKQYIHSNEMHTKKVKISNIKNNEKFDTYKNGQTLSSNAEFYVNYPTVDSKCPYPNFPNTDNAVAQHPERNGLVPIKTEIMPTLKELLEHSKINNLNPQTGTNFDFEKLPAYKPGFYVERSEDNAYSASKYVNELQNQSNFSAGPNSGSCLQCRDNNCKGNCRRNSVLDLSVQSSFEVPNYIPHQINYQTRSKSSNQPKERRTRNTVKSISKTASVIQSSGTVNEYLDSTEKKKRRKRVTR